MSTSIFDFAVIGGDMRQVMIANNLIDRGFSVNIYGLQHPTLSTLCSHAPSFAAAIHASRVIITPIPISKDGIHVNSQSELSDLTIKVLCDSLTESNRLYGGCFTNQITEFCEKHGVGYLDFMENEEVTLFNTIATAEGAIAEAICAGNTNLHGSSCLVIGFGRCARTLAEKLKGLNVNVTIAARSKDALAAAYTLGFQSVAMKDLEMFIGGYSYIFNTVPSLVLTKDLLSCTRKDVVIIDIASAPGGVDFVYANEQNITAKLCLSLPGKYSPKSSADYLTSYLLSNLGKK